MVIKRLKGGNKMKGINFVALDFETANEDHSSICQIGMARFVDGMVVDSFNQLINPHQPFVRKNTGIHNITANDVANAPSLAEVIDEFWAFVGADVLVTHTAFDKTSINKATEYYQLPINNNVTWLDSARVTRKAWPQFAERGYGLKNICEHLGVAFDHHDALEDAIACGKVLVEACTITGNSIADWQKVLSEQPKVSSKFSALAFDNIEANPDGELAGNVIVFTGNLTLSRAEAAELAARAGCELGKNVTRKTTMLVVGDQDMSLLAGHEKSSKHRKAEDLIAKGQSIEILKESDFMVLV